MERSYDEEDYNEKVGESSANYRVAVGIERAHECLLDTDEYYTVIVEVR